MNEILDDDLASNRPHQSSLYGKYSNLPAALVILGALFKIMHWPYSENMLFTGICGHFGIELGYAIALGFKHKTNNIRLVIATFFLIFLSGFWKFGHKAFTWIDLSFIGLIAASAIVTYILVNKKRKKQ